MNTTPVYFTGIDIGSTASKTVVLKEGKIEDYLYCPQDGMDAKPPMPFWNSSKAGAMQMTCAALPPATAVSV